MGIKDRIDSAAQAAAERRSASDERGHYDVEVNKGSLNVGWFTRTLNARWKDGWRLAHVIEQHGNTLVVFERRGAGSTAPPDQAPGPGWWRASDGRWYPPESRPTGQ